MADSRDERFRQLVWDYYTVHGRHELPWRIPEPDGTFDPYHILVSEMMLQQTQVARVIPKYAAFMRQFPSPRSLGEASLAQVLVAWQGLGYNRRAKFLWQTAQRLVADYGSKVPIDEASLLGLPGIGRNTAGAIRAYAFNEPAVFIETNIRTVFIHHFFHDAERLPDSVLIERIAATLSGEPRVWYWALMDYGAYLKRSAGNASRASATYVRQSSFAGSERQIRGRILRLLAAGSLHGERLKCQLDDARTSRILANLEREGLIDHQDGIYSLPM